MAPLGAAWRTALAVWLLALGAVAVTVAAAGCNTLWGIDNLSYNDATLAPSDTTTTRTSTGAGGSGGQVSGTGGAAGGGAMGPCSDVEGAVEQPPGACTVVVPVRDDHDDTATMTRSASDCPPTAVATKDPMGVAWSIASEDGPTDTSKSRAFLYFDLPAGLNAKTVTSATMRLHSANGQSTDDLEAFASEWGNNLQTSDFDPGGTSLGTVSVGDALDQGYAEWAVPPNEIAFRLQVYVELTTPCPYPSVNFWTARSYLAAADLAPSLTILFDP
ncbi:MAG: hypothetical protein JRI23_30005 [Deltaproteobacteria bacterium]|jgi:hypothetical protein|nr:hypothetical protein [Deltaproteobacteria bacterium]MBW2536385.1 hypothetical protein [Deltaproteobacteria bacterium]